MATAMVFYFMNCVQGAVQSIRPINDIMHGTQWTIGHAHLALVGWISFGVMGVIFYLVPTLSRKKLFSTSMASGLQLWSMVGGFALMWIALSIGGLIQGNILLLALANPLWLDSSLTNPSKTRPPGPATFSVKLILGAVTIQPGKIAGPAPGPEQLIR